MTEAAREYRAAVITRVLTGPGAASARPGFFGARMSNVFQEVMRGPSQWSVADRELMAAFVSNTNACVF